MEVPTKSIRLLFLLLLSLLIILIWSFVGCFDFFTWILEVLPVVIGVGLLMYIYKHFKFTDFTYTLIFIHAVILLIGAHYTYEHEPLFEWFKEIFNWNRNNYDRVGHFAQGFIPAIITREVLLRKSPLRQGGWLFFIILSICLAISAVFELFECSVAIATGQNADKYLALQGDQWDTQKDMALCLVGSLVSLLILPRFHNKALLNLAIRID